MPQILFAFFSLMSSLLWADGLMRTEIHYFRPFVTGVQKPDYQIKAVVHGKCLAQSAMILREDAWQCQTTSKTIDPCFAKSGDARDLLCFFKPEAKEAILLKLDEPLPHIALTTLDVSRTHPWLIQLENGLTCSFVLGGYYHCEDESLLHPPLLRCAQPWHILQKKAERVGHAKIASVWF